MKNITQNLFFAIIMVFSTVSFAQSIVSGTVIEPETNMPLPGANILIKGTSIGATTDFDGNFTITSDATSGQIVISYIGYESKTISFTGSKALGKIRLEQNETSLDEVVIVGSGIIDLAEGRKTPVAVSTIRAKEIQQKIGSQDISATMVNTPSVYVSGASGGFGDSQISVRGFEQDNTAYLLNGQPINGMEDGKMYWSNWSGMNDIASAIQIQRGLGSSKLAISSVGGTVNFVTKSTESQQGGFLYGGFANDNYYKSTVGYNSGKSESGWGTSFLFTHWQGDGYNDGTYGQGQNYFFSIGYTPNEKHNFNFLITGAPQWHDQNWSKSISTYQEYGRKYNNNYGYYNGEYMSERRNFYHKPVANLNWDYKISEKSNLSTVLYASWGRGGGTGNLGSVIRTDDGYIDYDAIYAENEAIEDGAGGYGYGGGYITRSSINAHSWYGAVSNFETELSDYITFNVGLDLRTYYGEHYRVVENFHGLETWNENITLRDQNNNHQRYGYAGEYKIGSTNRDMAANPWTAMFAEFREDEKIGYSNDERISYGGLFTQMEYSKDNFSTFFQGSLSSQHHQRFDHYQYADQSLIDGTSPQGTGTPLPDNITDGVDSEKVNNVGFNVKAGAAYIIGDSHKFFGNIGYYSRQPYHDNIYLNFTNQINPLTENEKIFGLELGYSFASQNFTANVNLYRTSWKDRVVTTSYIEDEFLFYKTNQGVEQLHSGIEIDAAYRPIMDLKIKGFLSLGDWEYKGNAETRISDENQNVISTEVQDVDGGKVGNAAQFTVGIGADYRIFERFSVDADFRFYDKLYASVGAVKDNLELPSYNLVDMGVSYSLPLDNDFKKSIDFRFNLNNVFDYVYLSDLSSNIAAEPEDETYKGINVANQGYFGFGRTWSASVRFNF
ncbi:TonB-dependent receptor [Formosa haliotis]|uniref:TonB-dependent receptor n=1 Tax=Formosa haliotis TaxID=1555194 RepID=UPI000826BC34|nr:carboxypeptidase-like regulatory domain-containing protein [Formosa haliotis]